MAIADKKKCQAFINAIGREVAECRASQVRIDAIKTKFVASNPMLTGTALAGNVPAVNTALANLATALGSATFTAMINAMSSACNDALDL